MSLSKRLYMVIGLVAIIALALSAVTLTSILVGLVVGSVLLGACGGGSETVIPCSDPTGANDDATEAHGGPDADNIQEQCGPQDADD